MPSTNRGEHAAEIVGEASCSGADESIPSTIAAESPSFFSWMWIQILTACSGLWGAREGGLSGPRTSGLASGAQRMQEDSESEVSSRVADSKLTWSEVPSRDIHHSVSSVPSPRELSVWQKLKASAPHFFQDFGDHLDLGRQIGEGGQAQIFEAKWRGGKEFDLVLKVFKLGAGFSLSDLERLWPRTMRKSGEDSSEFGLRQRRSSAFVFEETALNAMGSRCIIMGATLLEHRRFAFLMQRYGGDLRSLLDKKVKENTHRWKFDLLSRNRTPFSFHDSILIMLQIANGMYGLHREGVLHRDLKAANVLIDIPKDVPTYYVIVDYECAMFVQGTGFWRAPEVLQELQKSEESRSGEIWTEKLDVYSFGMTCYEILTGQIPFAGYTKRKWGDVIASERPLPNYVFFELRELVEACWHAQPSQRPSFRDIIEKLISLQNEHTYFYLLRRFKSVWM